MRSDNKTSYSSELFREYASPRGMSLTGRRCADKRFRYLQNMYIDYEGGGNGVESIPGYRKIHAAKDRIHSLAIQQVGRDKFIIIHEGGSLYRLGCSTDGGSKIADISDCDSNAFVFGENCLIADGSGLYLIDGEGKFTPLCHESYIAECSCFALFDGRLFLSGSRSHRGKIFYSSRLDGGDVVFSQDNFIFGGGDIISLLSHRGRLWVFRSAEGGRGVITCHKADEGYPICLSLGGVRPVGQVLSLEDKILLLAADGLWAIENTSEEEKTGLSHRSAEIEPMLTREDIYTAKLCLWKGYAVIGCGERIYLGDRRGSDKEYGWYFLAGIGSHSGDRRVYRYSDTAPEGYFAHRSAHAPAESEVISLTREDGEAIFYTEEGGKKYSVYPTDERWGGNLLPAENLLSDGELLCFTTDEGIFLFNSDMRGTPPERLRSSDDFNEKEYERLYGRVIHPDFYSFDGHAPSYIIATEYDDCGLPLTEKTSVGRSLFLRVKAPRGTPLTVSVLTDGKTASIQRLIAPPHNDRQYEWECPTGLISLTERANGWVEKQIVIESREFASPFGLCSLAFKYQPKEKLKKG